MFLEERLEDYNMEPKLVSMQLVLFKVIPPMSWNERSCRSRSLSTSLLTHEHLTADLSGI